MTLEVGSVSDSEWAFIAGLIEASGRVAIDRDRGHARLRLLLSGLTPGLVQWLALRLPKLHMIRRKQGRVTPYMVTMEAATVLAQTYPHLVTKQAEAKLVFRFAKSLPRKGVRVTPERETERAAVERELKKLQEAGA